MSNSTRPRRKKRVTPGYVYVVESGGLYKIGRSRNFDRRLEEIRTGSPLRVRVVFAVEDDESSRTESILHRLFAHKRSHGEWFKLDYDELSDVCGLLAAGEVYA